MAENLDMVLSHLRARRAADGVLDDAREVARLRTERGALVRARDDALGRRKSASDVVGRLMRDQERSDEDEAALEEARRASGAATDEAAAVDERLDALEARLDELTASLPNLLDDVVPDGDDDNDNEVVSTWGDPKDTATRMGWPDDFEPKWHDDVAEGLNGWMAENAVAVSGARFVALSGQIARLNRALCSFFLDLHTTHHGYTEVAPPLIVSRSSLTGTSQLPKFEEDLFKITPESHKCNGEDAFLIPTAEVPLTNLHRDSVLEHDDLPVAYVALTPCFRAEAGSYGRDTRGLVRTHQFDKVELVRITDADASDDEHEKLTRHAEACLEALGLPYRKVRLCSGDVGFSARHCYDLEVWLPGQSLYREISSCSNTGDFQAKRMGLRYRPRAPPPPDADADSNNKNNKKKKAKKPKPRFCHTINGSGLAVGRTLVAVLENYQRPDGSVVVPDVLRPYMGGTEVLEPKKK